MRDGTQLRRLDQRRGDRRQRHPGFLFAILLIVLFAGGSYLDWFPLRGLVSENWDELAWPAPDRGLLLAPGAAVLALVIGGFARLTMLTKNSFLEEINKQYVVTARAKGLTERRVLYGHVFRNAMLIVIAGFPAPSSACCSPARC